MKNNRLAVSIHILSMAAIYKREDLTSDYIASSVNTNAVVIRRLISQLKKAGLLHTERGVPGILLTKKPNNISLLDIYYAIQAEKTSSIFSTHENPNPNCDIGAKIKATLEMSFERAQQAVERELSTQTLQDVIEDLFSN
ncbi:Rrf2 family transcriptional regulator [Pontibacillus litoralis]|uniref:Rrf2 family transcriptional regulator n=1 Tax=Pontibacillus litoralis JSM 072002 TaxID=1385512 RepID=A0A0A5FY81_9BACI|nr:Rrf2 family transcriptional regulator [Pontibacillus litoralis]KGX85776.1 Rrf2 family transcriptional regulator [Pontibacillus litoralis JSM 072002]